jgi:ABC-type polysaccharide/polyol phosphate transport system ATPase subunit
VSESDAPVAVRIENVDISFRVPRQGANTTLGALKHLGKRKSLTHNVDAIQGMSFDIKAGSSLAIIGQNGAGKTSLLRAISGMIPPTSGRIEVHGEVSTLLALDTGFNKQLTGRENVVLSGLAAGNTKAEIEAKIDDIVAFAEIGEAIDRPVSTYSAGTGKRLAFSVAAHLEPDILIIDEALSTGDAAFRVKSRARINEIISQAHTVIMVSHALNTLIELCDDAIWIDKGKFVMRGTPKDVVKAYLEFMHVEPTTDVMDDI